ncbi:hypothetical protein C5167_012136 [Papaver somniferum]|uniref:Uncharacterized protein n=1 Tax=Papaver somniferum TaxID=3469 RepID=A0A4Y7IWL4_PAPSO|nr:hypothetical protein C5167_012136 [Papaver somniferum]
MPEFTESCDFYSNLLLGTNSGLRNMFDAVQGWSHGFSDLQEGVLLQLLIYLEVVLVELP